MNTCLKTYFFLHLILKNGYELRIVTISITILSVSVRIYTTNIPSTLGSEVLLRHDRVLIASG